MEDLQNTFPLWERNGDNRSGISLDVHYNISIDKCRELICLIFFNSQEEMESGFAFIGELSYWETLELCRELMDKVEELKEFIDEIRASG